MSTADKELLLSCDCAGRCGILAFEAYDWKDIGEGKEYWLEIYDHSPSSWRFRYRLRAAWRLIRGRHTDCKGLLFNSPAIKKMHDFTGELLADMDSDGPKK